MEESGENFKAEAAIATIVNPEGEEEDPEEEGEGKSATTAEPEKQKVGVSNYFIPPSAVPARLENSETCSTKRKSTKLSKRAKKTAGRSPNAEDCLDEMETSRCSCIQGCIIL